MFFKKQSLFKDLWRAKFFVEAAIHNMLLKYSSNFITSILFLKFRVQGNKENRSK